ncbi:hypothetical protein LTS08_006979 [Lithohypha guttulata]|uniref:uncharacterized protein n=1 Tax=Lithohypha guttulata TaxID=1690604 RepID=UPI002DDF3BD2|nr:hypothetical protein LTR51_002029 [Lithohypha guttulata]KAK5097565.1 hypothetical protein LTS08_006979 [Lithohypha guttulata]
MSSQLTITSKSTLPSGYEMPVLGYGVYQTPYDVCYRHVDSARVYRNEQPCAEAIKASGLKREDIFFTSKIGPRDMGYEKTKKAIQASFAETGLGYADLFLIHAPYGGREARQGTWRALVEAQNDGLIRSIGVSNYGVHHLNELKQYIETSDIGGKIAVGQWEIHPWLPRPDIVQWARENDVVVQAWSPLVRAERPNESILGQLGKKHNKSWAQVLIRWSLQKGYVPLPKSVTPARIEENANVFDFELDEEDMKSLHFPDSYQPCSWDPTTSSD